MSIESKRVCNKNSLKRCIDKENTPDKIPNDLLHYSKPCCIILWTVSQNAAFLSLFSLCCFLRVCTLKKSCSVQRWNFTKLSSFNLVIFPILVEILCFGKAKAFYLSSLLSRKHFMVSPHWTVAPVINSFSNAWGGRNEERCGRVFHWQC